MRNLRYTNRDLRDAPGFDEMPGRDGRFPLSPGERGRVRGSATNNGEPGKALLPSPLQQIGAFRAFLKILLFASPWRAGALAKAGALCVFALNPAVTLCSLCLLLLSESACAAPAPTNPVPVVLTFDYPTNALPTVRSFRVYSATNISVPDIDWRQLTNCWATNLVTTNLSSAAFTNAALQIPLPVQPGPRWFVVTASNFWGESPFSNPVATPPLPGGAANLNAQRGWE